MNQRGKQIASVAVLASAGVLEALAPGCDSDILDVDVDLQRQVYSADFGANQGTVPLVACDPAGPGVCGASVGTTNLETGNVSAMVDLACDSATSRCYAQAQVLGTNAVDVLQDDDFLTKVERKAVVVVRDVDVKITVPLNTLTFDVPRIDIFVGPPGSLHETDSGVVPVGATQPLAAGTVVTDTGARHMVVAADSPAHAFIADSIMSKHTMVFLVSLAPRVEAGAPIPAGAFEVDLVPRVTLGLPR